MRKDQPHGESKPKPKRKAFKRIVRGAALMAAAYGAKKLYDKVKADSKSA